MVLINLKLYKLNGATVGGNDKTSHERYLRERFFLLYRSHLKDYMNKYYQFRRQIEDKINKIPQKNKAKFQADYLKLIELAQKDDYENFEL